MAELEMIAMCILIPAYGVLCYIAGKGDILSLIPKMLLEKANELEEKQKSMGDYAAEGLVEGLTAEPVPEISESLKRMAEEVARRAEDGK